MVMSESYQFASWRLPVELPSPIELKVPPVTQLATANWRTGNFHPSGSF
jgi:hypothetical protein